MSSYSVIYVTCKDIEEARSIARDLVLSDLVACANLFDNMNSIYKWDGRLCEDSESVLLLKARTQNFSIIEKRIKELHSYDCPCIISFNIDQGSEEFLNYISSL
jgi:periplasmic divalent cation tolerance protein